MPSFHRDLREFVAETNRIGASMYSSRSQPQVTAADNACNSASRCWDHNTTHTCKASDIVHTPERETGTAQIHTSMGKDMFCLLNALS